MCQFANVIIKPSLAQISGNNFEPKGINNIAVNRHTVHLKLKAIDPYWPYIRHAWIFR